MSSQSNLLNSSYHNYYFTISAERYEHSRSKRHHPRRVFSHTGYQIIRYTRDIILYTVRHFSTFALIVFLSFISNSGFSVHSRSLDTNQNWRSRVVNVDSFFFFLPIMLLADDGSNHKNVYTCVHLTMAKRMKHSLLFRRRSGGEVLQSLKLYVHFVIKSISKLKVISFIFNLATFLKLALLS